MIAVVIIITFTLLTFLGLEVFLAATATSDAIILFHTQLVLAVLQGASLLFLVVYVIKTWEMAAATRKSAEAAERSIQELREARDQETSPYVTAYFDIVPGEHIIYFIVKNTGRTIARNVIIEFEPILQSTSVQHISKQALFQYGLSIMPPEYEVKTIVDDSVNYFKSDLPLVYDVKISYAGGMNNDKRTTSQRLDLFPYRSLRWAEKKDLSDLIVEVKNIGRQQEKIARVLEAPSRLRFRMYLRWIQISKVFRRR